MGSLACGVCGKGMMFEAFHLAFIGKTTLSKTVPLHLENIIPLEVEYAILQIDNTK